MKILRFVLVGLGLLFLASSLIAPAKAQSLSYFLKFENSNSAPALEGSSTVVGYEKQTILSSYSFTTHTTVSNTTSGSTVGKPIFDGLQCIGIIDAKNLPLLMFAVCSGQNFTAATITGARLGASPYKFLEVKVGNVVFSNVSVQGTDGDNSIVNFTLVPVTVAITTYPQNADGSAGTPVSKSWNFVKNTP